MPSLTDTSIQARRDRHAGSVLENFPDLVDRAPVTGGHRSARDLVDAAEVANRLHVTAVFADHELPVTGEDPDQPLPLRREANGRAAGRCCGLTEDADESHDARRRRSRPVRSAVDQRDDVLRIADGDLRFEWEPVRELRARVRLRDALADDERARGADDHDIKIFQPRGQGRGPERPVSTNIDAAKKDNE